METSDKAKGFKKCSIERARLYQESTLLGPYKFPQTQCKRVVEMHQQDNSQKATFPTRRHDLLAAEP